MHVDEHGNIFPCKGYIDVFAEGAGIAFKPRDNLAPTNQGELQ